MATATSSVPTNPNVHASPAAARPSPAEAPAGVTKVNRPTKEQLLAAKLKYLEDIGVDSERILRMSPSSLESSLLTIAEKVHFLQQSGVTAARAIRFVPSLLGCSIKRNLEPKLRYLLDVMGYTIEDVRRFPIALTYSLDRRIIPRHTALKAADRRLPSLSTLLCRRPDAFQRSLEPHPRRRAATLRRVHHHRPVVMVAECSCPGCPCTELDSEV